MCHVPLPAILTSLIANRYSQLLDRKLAKPRQRARRRRVLPRKLRWSALSSPMSTTAVVARGTSWRGA